ncbi:MAG TPA: hypothetical protein PLF42_00495 [Anaerolineales bacterium]|nr:hypothetical protein [Anaerolineales bacterium]
MFQKISVYSSIILILLSSCIYTSSASEEDNFPITAFEFNEECPKVCWLGIQPSITTRSDAVAIISSSDQIVQESLQIRESGLKFEWFTDRQKRSAAWVIVAIKNDMVNSLSFGILHPITVGDFIEVFGEPNEISIELTEAPDARYIYYVLYYPELQVMIEAHNYNFSAPNASDIPKGVIINRDFDDDRLPIWLSKKYADRQPWLGYGQTEKYLPDKPPAP